MTELARRGGGAVSASRSNSAASSEARSECSQDALHDRLVAYVHSLAHSARRGVCGEHSYARARGSTGAGRVRALLAPAPPTPAPIDVRAASPPPREPPLSAPPSDSDDDGTDAEDEHWAARAAAAAPAAPHRRLAAAAAALLRDMRLARLAGGGRAARRERVRAAAARLRRALAPAWASGAPAWLHATLLRELPRAERREYDAAVAELARAAPRLAARLGAAASPARSPAAAVVGPESSPWLVWVSGGDAALDARWEPRLAALVHTRVLRGAGGAPGAAAAPEPWCAAAVAAVRSALTDALAEAGSRAVILGGCGAGAAAALVLARGAGGAGGAEGGVRGLALVAPALGTAERARDSAALAACRLPLLLVLGTAGGACARSEALRLTTSGERRALEVRGADQRLLLPPRRRAALRLPQRALDHALAEEVVRWALETAEREEEPVGPTPRVPPPLPHIVREIDLTEEYAHLPPASPPPAPAPAAASPAPQSSGGGNIEGCTVSRVSGGTPLALPPPRRAPAPAAPAAAPLAAADILQLPIVFADDEAAGGALTVTSGKLAPRPHYTRVVLAPRGARPQRRLLVRRARQQ